LVVGHPQPERMDIGAAMAPDFAAARKIAERSHPAIVVFTRTKQKEFLDFCRFLEDTAPEAQWILSADGLKPHQIMEFSNSGRLFDLIEGFDDPTLMEKLHAAIETLGLRAQQRKLAELFAEQSENLIRLSHVLEGRVERRNKMIRNSRRNLEATKIRLESFQRALAGVHRADSVAQMEQTLNETLSPAVPGLQALIRFANQTSLKTSAPSGVLAIEIPFRHENLRGEVLFSTSDQRKLSAVESDFLHEVAEALALALSRLSKLDLAATLKSQWQATFDSIPHPLCLTTVDYEIVKLNRAFQQSCDQSFRDLIGMNCFNVFFKPGFVPPPESTFRASREVREGPEHFEVSGEQMNLTHGELPMKMILLRPVTEEVRYERRIFEASKLAELGTIGSSIAHELNNPLGGMLSFLQLILLDLKKDNVLHPDIKAMEQATLRCRDIVQNLLSFARKQDLGSFVEVDLKDVVEKAVKLIELQSKSKGIEILNKRADSELPISASENALSQAVCNLLQNSIDAIGDKLASNSLYPGRISLEVNRDESNVYLRISDNGTGIRTELQSRIFNPLFTTRDPGQFSGMGLTTAFTIISEHHGSLEILSQTGSGTTAIIALPISRKSNF
jgi:signal transduction histidine kinase